ncbi:hypothetical protein QAD02_021483 [Eretmocerus hayati]|uniref:Uncharacterized protein n=1 Tax=Eretmocerus hayati TaxID=131215 RepID=A0ACC2PQ29_9HYME|nr:hypothetical protein QAD02_021483 [Eretmocerus hayati]
MASEICKEIDVDDSSEDFIRSFFQDWNKDDSPGMSQCNSEEFLKQLAEKFMAELEKLKNNGPTAASWVQYFECVMLILQFVETERTGNWPLHLQTIEKMLPIFHAAGHFAYAKSAQIYLQDMANLELSMDPEEFQQFVDGFSTVHKSDEGPCGVWADMIIEQTLDRFFGIDLNHGRARYLMGMPAAFSSMESFENYVGVQSASSEQHVELREGRMKRDQADLEKLKFWLDHHKPFEPRTSLISLSTGIVGDPSFNCPKRLNQTSGRSLNGQFISNDQSKSIDVRILFQRLAIVFNGNEGKTKEAFAYELAPYPLCLFDEHGLMRGNTKSDLYKLCKTSLCSAEFLSTLRNVTDGGWLLHQVVWSHSKTYPGIMEIYLRYILKHFGSDAVVVFDGYSRDIIGTKFYERYRRTERSIAPDVAISASNMVNVHREHFLSNVANKYQFVQLLSSYLSQNHIQGKIALGDAVH